MLSEVETSPRKDGKRGDSSTRCIAAATSRRRRQGDRMTKARREGRETHGKKTQKKFKKKDKKQLT